MFYGHVIIYEQFTDQGLIRLVKIELQSTYSGDIKSVEDEDVVVVLSQSYNVTLTGDFQPAASGDLFRTPEDEILREIIQNNKP